MIERIMTLLARDALDGSAGVLAATEVVDRLADTLQRSPVGESPRERIIDGLLRASSGDGPVMWVEGSQEASDAGRIIDAPSVVDGLAFTHRLTADEIATDRLDVSVDLALLARLTEADGGLYLGDGEPLAMQIRSRRGAGPDGVDERTRRLLGPAGWLARYEAGTVVAVRADHGVLTIEEASEPSAPPVTSDELHLDLRDHILAALDTANGGDGSPADAESLHILGVIDEWLPNGPDTPPLAELFAAAGLETCGDLVGRPGSWKEHAELTRHIHLLAGHGPHLPDDELTTIARVAEAFTAWLADPDTVPSPGLVDLLTKAPFALGCLGEELRSLSGDGAVISAFLDTLPQPSGRRASSIDTVRAMALAMQDQAVEADALLDQVLAGDPHHPGANELKAWFDSDRGDARAALRRLQMVQELDDDTVAILKRRAGDDRPTVGRNDPCPCGSGRKFKQCHLNRTGIDDSTRLSWMMDKARDYLAHAAPYHLLADVTESSSVRSMVEGELIAIDLALFDHGWLTRFLTARGPLLPDVERDLMTSWVDGHHPGVFRVATMGETITLVEVDGNAEDLEGHGHTYEVRAGQATQQIEVGQFVWLRLVPWNDRWETSGLTLHMPSSRSVRRLTDARAAADWPEVYALMVGMRPDPPMDVRTGRLAMNCRVLWSFEEDRTPEISEALTAEFEAATNGWTAVTNEGETWWEVGDSGAMSAASTTRAAHDAALAYVAGRWPDLEVASEIAMPGGQVAAFRADEDTLAALRGDDQDDQAFDFDDLDLDDMDGLQGLDLGGLELGDLDDPDQDGERGEADPAMAEMQGELVRRMARQYVEHWVDEPQPLLDDRSPRQAAGDPALRSRLEELVAGFEHPDSPIKAAEVRITLGLDER